MGGPLKHAIALGALAIAAGAASTAEGAPFDWTGFYTGIHAGYGVGQEHDNQSQLFPVSSGPGGTTAVTSTATPSIVPDQYDLNGFVGGVHAGYNYQLERYVLGIEGDLDYSGLAGSADGVYLTGVTHLRHLSFESRWQGSARLRVGFTPFDRMLLYVTGGLAVAEGRLSNSGTDNGFSDLVHQFDQYPYRLDGRTWRRLCLHNPLDRPGRGAIFRFWQSDLPNR